MGELVDIELILFLVRKARIPVPRDCVPVYFRATLDRNELLFARLYARVFAIVAATWSQNIFADIARRTRPHVALDKRFST